MSSYQKIINQIKQQGFIYIDEFMVQALSANDDSYYRSKKTINIDGDFLTSPEVSQLFGEMLGLWCIDQWRKLGSPKACNLVELGSGSGALLQSALKVIKLEAEMINSIHIQIFDINEEFIKLQKNNLKEYNISWHKNIEKINELPSIVIANEFFDALPVKQYIKQHNHWHEIMIKSNAEHKLFFDIMFTTSRHSSRLNKQYSLAADQAIIEESVAQEELSHYLASHLKQYGGSALIIDYGYNIEPIKRLPGTFISTLQAIKDHQYVNVLNHVGKADLTAHVDFYKIIVIFNKYDLRKIYYNTQRQFLISYGIEFRASELCTLNPDQADIIKNQLSRLIDTDKMGNLFKILAVNA